MAPVRWLLVSLLLTTRMVISAEHVDHVELQEEEGELTSAHLHLLHPTDRAFFYGSSKTHTIY